MRKYIFIISVLFSLLANSQVVTTSPELPVTDQSVIIYFHASEGNAALAGYTGDVYAHTGVITNESASGSDWKYVKTDWGVNTPETKMTRIDQDLYELQITPDIKSYYGVPNGEIILKMAFVFRSGVQVSGNYLVGRSETGGDIFVDVIEGGLSVTFLQPSIRPAILASDDSLVVVVKGNETDSVSLFMDNVLRKTVSGDLLQDTLFSSEYGKHFVWTIGYGPQGMASDTFYFYIRKPVEIRPLPEGVHDGINYPDNSTAILSLLAPKKEFAFVIGDFNDWEIDSSYYMYMTPDSLRFWAEIPDLLPGQEYIFQYLVDGTIRIGDPYADKISDPWNDKYISEQTYPGLKQYPEGKTTGTATFLQTGQPEYQWQIEDFQPPAKTDMLVYELLVRDFTQDHSFQGVTDTLDYLKRLGVNVIELMPVNEFEGNISWGYNPIYYFAPDKYYGPKDKLKQLVDECHKRGMAVVMDLVLNHAYQQCPLVLLYFDGTNPTPDNPWFNVHSNFTNPDAQWGYDFNHESLYTQQFVDSINSYWMTQYKIDGFRFDFTKGFGNNIKGSNDPWGSLFDADRIRLLERMAHQIWDRKSDAIVIFEHLAENSEEKILANYGILMWGNESGSYGNAAAGYVLNNNSDFSWISYKLRGWNEPNVLGYMESHDEERLMYKCVHSGYPYEAGYNIRDTSIALNRMLLDALFFFTVPGA